MLHVRSSHDEQEARICWAQDLTIDSKRYLLTKRCQIPEFASGASYEYVESFNDGQGYGLELIAIVSTLGRAASH